jgi:hypothetical protein
MNEGLNEWTGMNERLSEGTRKTEKAQPGTQEDNVPWYINCTMRNSGALRAKKHGWESEPAPRPSSSHRAAPTMFPAFSNVLPQRLGTRHPRKDFPSHAGSLTRPVMQCNTHYDIMMHDALSIAELKSCLTEVASSKELPVDSWDIEKK